MTDLTFKVAQHLAGSLVTIGHPTYEDAINATALDLVKWCRGATIQGRVLTAESQAAALVDEARYTWERWRGTKQFRDLFRDKFAGDAAHG
jgi:hypothetical protein